jgi:hypothetical protein
MIHEIAERYPPLVTWENRLATILATAIMGLSQTTGFLFAGHFETRTPPAC